MISSSFDNFFKRFDLLFVRPSQIALSQKIQQSYLERITPQTGDDPAPLKGRSICPMTHPSNFRTKDEIQQVMHDVVEYCDKLSQRDEVSDEEKAWIQDILLQLSGLNESLFSRTLLSHKEKLQRILSSDLDTLLTQEEKEPSLKQNKDHLLDIALAKAQLSTKMGYLTKRAGGCNGAMIIHDLEDHPVGVFKTPQTDLISRIKHFFKRCLGQERLFNRRDIMNESYSEVAMYYFSEIFGFNLAPAAKMTRMFGREGAFIGFLKDYEELKNVEISLKKKATFDQDELITWQLAMVAIFASWNFDPHNCNILVSMTNDKLTHVKVIDAGNNFAERLPEWGCSGYRTYPSGLSISDKDFDPKVIHFIKENLTIEKLNAFIERVKKDHRPDFISNDMAQILATGILVLRESVVSGKIKTPSALLNIKSAKDLNKVASPGTILDVGPQDVSRVHSIN